MRAARQGIGSVLACVLAAAAPDGAWAGDHQDGSQVVDESSGDLTGLWAFVPEAGDRLGPLVVALGVKPFAVNMGDIGSDYDYSFRIRRASLEGAGAEVRSWTGAEELKLTCRFNRARQVHCDLNHLRASGDSVPAGSVAGDFGTTLHSMDRRLRVFVGLRTDPYMINTRAVHHCLDSGEVQFLTGERKLRNSFAESRINTIGIVAEIHQDLLPSARGLPLVAVAAESVLTSGGTERRIDRVGRAETTVFLIQDDDARNAWNSRDVFATDGLDTFREPMQRGLTAVDAHSRAGYWNRPHPLLELMLEDYLLVNPANAVDPLDAGNNHYLELEWAAYQGLDTAGLAGGRRLTDNSVSRFFSVFARQGRSAFAHLEALRQPLFRPTRATFPYMSRALDRLENVAVRALAPLLPIHGAIVGCP